MKSKAKSLICNAFVTYPSHLVWLSYTASSKRYLVDLEYTSLGLPPAGSAEVKTSHLNGRDSMDILQYGSIS